MTDAMVESMFPSLVSVLVEPSVQEVLTIEQKRQILEAAEAHVEEIDDAHFRVGMLFVVLDVDISDPDNPKMSISMDLNKLLKLGKN